MDVLAVKQVVSYAKKYALDNGPIVLELDTYRRVHGRGLRAGCVVRQEHAWFWRRRSHWALGGFQSLCTG